MSLPGSPESSETTPFPHLIALEELRQNPGSCATYERAFAIDVDYLDNNSQIIAYYKELNVLHQKHDNPQLHVRINYKWH